jgi:hypothetical protein
MVLVTALLLMAASPALASTVEGDTFSNFVFVRAAGGETNNISISGTNQTITITDSAGVSSGGRADCTDRGPTTVTCTTNGLYNFDQVIVSAGDGNDVVTLSLSRSGGPNAPGRSGAVSGGPGNDSINASASAASTSLAGDAGDDQITGGPSQDQIDIRSRTDIVTSPFDLDASQADLGNDTLLGGAGRDRIRAGAGADTVDAGDGGDFIESITLEQSFVGGVNSFSIADDNAVDQIVCGPNTPEPGDFADRGIGDAVQMGSGDRVDLDCEFVSQLVTCPSGSSCEVVATVTANAAASASSSLASAAASKRKGKQRTLGKEKLKLRPRQSLPVEVRLRKKKARRTLGKRSRMSATLKVELKRKGKDKKKKVRFKLKR